MKKQLLALSFCAALGLGAAIAAPVQDNPQSNNAPAAGEHEGRWQRADPNQQVQRLAKRLNLTQDQQNQILPILTNQHQQMQSIMNDSSLSNKDRREKMRTLREQTDTQVKAVLTDSQKQQYEQMQQQQRERMQQRRENGQNGSDSNPKS